MIDKEQLAADMAATFLGSPEGRRVLSYLQTAFAHDRPRYKPKHRNDMLPEVHPAFTDGQCSVLKEIEAAIEHIRPNFNKPDHFHNNQ